MHYWVRRAAARVWSHMSPAYQIGDVVTYVNLATGAAVDEGSMGIVIDIDEFNPCMYCVQFIGKDNPFWCLPRSIRSIDEKAGTDQSSPSY